ncbi:MAG: hypothetical protein ACJ741_12880 [Pyrinomonadaceae bacterium]
MSKITKRTAARLLAALVCALVVAAISLYSARHALASEYKTFQSPDGKFKVVVYSYPMLISSVGGAGDAAGFVRLYDSRGHVLEEEGVEMVQLVDQIEWEKEKVDIKLIAEWRLPAQ